MFHVLHRFLKWRSSLGLWATLKNFIYIAFSGEHPVQLYLNETHYPISVRKNNSDLVIFEQIFIDSTYDCDLPFTPKIIVDAGANAGFASLFFSVKYPDAKILAIEPDSENFELLKKNTQHRANISREKAGLWSRSGFLKVKDPEALKCSLILESSADPFGSKIRAITIQDVISILGSDHIDLLKIDIEGAEFELFSKNANTWLPRVRALIIEIHDHIQPGSAKALYTALNSVNFLQYQRDDALLIINRDFAA